MHAQQQADGTWIELNGNIEFSPNVFQTAESLTDEQKREFRVYEIIDVVKPAISVSQKISDPVYKIRGNKVERSYQAVDMTPVEFAKSTESEARYVRADRNGRLSLCDWTQLADSTADKEAWAAYRQALRDIPDQPGFPWDVQWPEQPNT